MSTQPPFENEELMRRISHEAPHEDHRPLDRGCRFAHEQESSGGRSDMTPDPGRLLGKTILVTGSTKGFGAAMARRFAGTAMLRLK